MTVTYIFDVLSSLDGYGSQNGNLAAPGQSSSPDASP
jgi:hypothetical protein